METTQSKIEQINRELREGPYRLQVVNPQDLEQTPQNARFMSPPKFAALVANIRRDGALTSVPLCIKNNGGLRVVSGNHRVRASISAEIKQIVVMVLEDGVGRSREVSIQLSHNALVGDDDPGKLAELYREIGDIAEAEYSGITIADVEQIEKDLSMPTSSSLATKIVLLAFTPHEVSQIAKIFARIDENQNPAVGFLFPEEHWNAFLAATNLMRKKRNILSSGTAIIKLLAIAEQYFAEHPEEDLSNTEDQEIGK